MYKRNIEARSRNHCCRGKQYYVFWVCVCRLRYSACNAHASCHLWPVWLHCSFAHYLINGMIFEIKLLNVKCVLLVCLQLLCETFLITRRIARDIIINIHRSSCQIRVILCFVERASLYNLAKSN